VGAVPPQRAGLFTSSGVGADGLLAWAERTGRRQAGQPGRGALRFAFYGRVSNEDYQDPVTSQARQLGQAGALVAGHGQIVAHFFDSGLSRTLAWARRPQAAALVAQLADPDREWDAVVIGEYERAFYGAQYASMAPLFEHYGVQLWTPEAGGRIDFGAEIHEQMMLALGLQSKREITRTRIRVRAAMATQTREQGRYLGGRPPYGYRLADAGPHPNKAHAAWGRRAHRLEPDPETAPQVAWIFAQRLAGHSMARIARALNDAGYPVPVRGRSGAQPASQRPGVDAAHGPGDPGQPPLHRAAGMESPAHRRRPDRPDQYRTGPPAGTAVEPARGLGDLRAAGSPGHRQRGRLHRRPGPERRARPGRSCRPLLPARRAAALRDLRAPAGILLVKRPGCLPVPPRPHQRHQPRPRPAEEHLHPRSPDPARLPALAILLRGPVPAGRSKEQGNAHDPVHAGAAEVIAYLRASSFTLTYDPRERTLRAGGTQDAAAIAIDRKLTGKAERS
jgi:site-specific DNA recombinase